MPEEATPTTVQALKFAARGESNGLIALTYAKTSKFIKESQRFRQIKVASFQPPVAKDGFLATNSLLASLIHLLRAYNKISEHASGVPRNMPVQVDVSEKSLKSTYLVLYAGWG